MAETGKTGPDGEPVLVQKPGLKRVRLASGHEVEHPSGLCLLQRAYDQAVIKHHARNQLIVAWAAHFAAQGWPTLVVATRTPHVLILEGLLERAGLDVRTLTSGHSTKERDRAFAWLTGSHGGVLVSPLVKEGVSLPELRAGVVADPVASPDLARQIIGRFIRKKPSGDNHARVVWFIDRQTKAMRSNCLALFDELERIRGYSFYHPCGGPGEVGQLYEAAEIT